MVLGWDTAVPAQCYRLSLRVALPRYGTLLDPRRSSHDSRLAGLGNNAKYLFCRKSVNIPGNHSHVTGILSVFPGSTAFGSWLRRKSMVHPVVLYSYGQSADFIYILSLTHGWNDEIVTIRRTQIVEPVPVSHDYLSSS